MVEDVPGALLGAPPVDARNTPWYAHDGGARRHRFDHHRPGADLDLVTHGDIAQYHGVGPDHDAVANGGVALGTFRRSASEDCTLVHQHIVANLCGLANDDPRAVVDEEPPSNVRTRMDLNAGHEPAEMRQQAGQRDVVPLPQAVCGPVQPAGV